MNTIQHAACVLLGTKGNLDFLDEYLAAVLLPDAIRMYSGNRKYSHFEQSSFNPSDVSYMKFPADMKNISKEIVAQAMSEDSYIVDEKPCVIGETTHVEPFIEHNQHLPPVMFNGIRIHLRQDQAFDAFIRNWADCSQRYDDIYVMPYGFKVFGNAFRSAINDVEQHGIFVLARMLSEIGIVFNQEWLDKHILPILLRDYSPAMAENTYKYMKIDPEINKAITAGDWSKLELNCWGLSEADYKEFYEGVIQAMAQDPEVTSAFTGL